MPENKDEEMQNLEYYLENIMSLKKLYKRLETLENHNQRIEQRLESLENNFTRMVAIMEKIASIFSVSIPPKELPNNSKEMFG